MRELENAVERAVVLCRGDAIARRGPAASHRRRASAPTASVPPIPGATLDELERYAILKTLEHTGGSTSQAAEILGISPRKIQYKLHEYGGTRRPATGEHAVAEAGDAGAEEP